MKNVLNIVGKFPSRKRVTSVLIPVVNFVWILKYCNKDITSAVHSESGFKLFGIQWRAVTHCTAVSQSVFSLYTCYVNIRVSQTIPQSLEAGTIQNHFIYWDVWNLKGCSIRICGFFKKNYCYCEAC